MNEKQLFLILQKEDSICTSEDLDQSLTQTPIETSESFRSSMESSEERLVTRQDTKVVEELILTKPLLIQSRRNSKSQKMKRTLKKQIPFYLASKEVAQSEDSGAEDFVAIPNTLDPGAPRKSDKKRQRNLEMLLKKKNKLR